MALVHAGSAVAVLALIDWLRTASAAFMPASASEYASWLFSLRAALRDCVPE